MSYAKGDKVATKVIIKKIKRDVATVIEFEGKRYVLDHKNK